MKPMLTKKQNLKKMRLITNWAMYNILEQNTGMELFKWVLSEIQIVFVIIQIYYNKIAQDSLFNGFDKFLQEMARFMNNDSILIDVLDNEEINNIENVLNTYHLDVTALFFFILVNIYVYSIIILAGLVYAKDTIFSRYISNIYRYLGWCRSWYCNVVFLIVHQLALAQFQNSLTYTNTNNTITITEILIMIMSIILCINNLIISILFCLYFMITLDDDNNYYNNHIQTLLTIIFKFGIVLISFIGNQDIESIVFIGWIIIFLGYRIWKHLRISSYTNLFYPILFSIFLSIEICQCIQIIIYIFTNHTNVYFLIILFTCTPLITIFFYNLFIYRYTNIVFIADPKHEDDIISRYLSLKAYISKGYKSDFIRRKIHEYEMIIEGELMDHLYNCMNCIYKKELETYIIDHTTRRLYYDKLRLHYLEKILLKGIEKYPESFKIMKELVMLYDNNKKDIIKCVLYLQKLNALCNNNNMFGKVIVVKYLLLKIKNLHDSTRVIESGLNLERLIECENFHNDFMNNLKKHAQSVNSFWRIFQESSISVSSLFDQAETIHKEFNNIEKLWKQYETGIMIYYSKPLYIYSKFLILLKNQEVLGESYLDMYNKLKIQAKESEKEDKFTDENLYSERNIIINVSACKDNLGEIMSCTSNINDMLGYDSLRLLKHNISILIPDIYQSIHNSLIEDYLYANKDNILNTNVIRYAKDINNHLVPIYLYIQLMIRTDLKLTFLTLLRPCPSADQAIILDINGEIITMTKNLRNLLDLPYNNEDNECNICDICPEIMDNIREIVKKVTNNSRNPNKKKKLRSMSNKTGSSNYLNLQKVEKSIKDNNLGLMNSEPQMFVFHQYSSSSSIYHHTQRKQMKFEVIIKLASEYINQLYFFLSIKYISRIEIEKSCNNKSIIKVAKNECSSEGNFQTERERNFSILDISNKKDIDESNLLPYSQYKSSLSHMKALLSMKEKAIDDKTIEPDMIISPFSSTRIRLINREDKIICNTSMKGNNTPINYDTKRLRRAKDSHIMIRDTKYDPYVNSALNGLNYGMNDSMENISSVNNHDKEKIQELFCESSSCIGKRSNYRRFMRKIYTALEIPYESRSLRMRLYTFLIYLMASITISLIAQVLLINTIIRIKQDINVINACNNRLMNYLELNRRTIMAYATYTGALSRQRMIEFGTPDHFTFMLLLTKDSIQNILSNNTVIRESLPNILEEFQLKFYNKRIDLYDYNSDGTPTGTYTTLNIFNAIDKIYTIMKRIYYGMFNPILSDDFFEDIFFIIRNGLNDLLIELQQSPDILLDDMKKISSNAVIMIIYIMIIIAIIGIIIISISIIGLIMIYNENLLIVENLLRISNEEITKEIENSKIFISLISMDNSKESKRLIPIEKSKGISNNTISKLPKRNNTRFFKNFAYKLIFWKYSLIMIMLLGGIVFIFGNFLRIYTNYKNRHELLCERMTNANFMLYQQCLSFAGIYEYITENKTAYVLNKPIQDVMSELIFNISHFTNFLSAFQTNNGEFESNYEYVFKGNLCLLNPTKEIPFCESLSGGIATQGLVTLNTYLYKILYDEYSDYEISNQTKEAQFEILKNEMFKKFEIIFYFGNLPGYLYLNKLIIEEIYDTSDIFLSDINSSIILCSLCLILSLIMIWYPIQKNIRNEGNKVKKMMQIYPKAFLLSNHMIKQFMLKSSNGIFGINEGFYNVA